MGHHVEIHGRGYKHMALCREIGGHEHVVCHTVGHLAYRGGCGRGNDHAVGPQTEIHMGMPFAGIGGKELADHRLLAQGREGDRGDEFLTGRSDDHLYLGPCLDKKAQKADALIGGYAAADAEDDMLTGQRGLARGHFSLSFMRVKQSLVFWAKSPFRIQS